MKVMNRNKINVKYKLFLGLIPIVDEEGYETGESESSYSSVSEIRASVSVNKGLNNTEQFGNLTDYDKVMTVDDISCPIDEESIVYINERTGEAEYIVKKRADSTNFISYAIRRVDRNWQSIQ